MAVSDGDTIQILDNAKRTHKVRLAGIDAPEAKQAFGTRARQRLAELVHGQAVVVGWSKRDRYRRIVGKVSRGGGGEDVGLQLVREGFAWHFTQYAKEQPAADRATYSAAEREARATQRGLWADAAPVPPWEWRSQRTRGDAAKASQTK